MFAVISDIHSNIEALTAVMEDIDRRGIKKIVCLGDVVGYGPNPRECIDIVIERCEGCICGNHDHRSHHLALPGWTSSTSRQAVLSIGAGFVSMTTS